METRCTSEARLGSVSVRSRDQLKEGVEIPLILVDLAPGLRKYSLAARVVVIDRRRTRCRTATSCGETPVGVKLSTPYAMRIVRELPSELPGVATVTPSRPPRRGQWIAHRLVAECWDRHACKRTQRTALADRRRSLNWREAAESEPGGRAWLLALASSQERWSPAGCRTGWSPTCFALRANAPASSGSRSPPGCANGSCRRSWSVPSPHLAVPDRFRDRTT